MVAQYITSLVGTNLRKPKKISVTVVNSPQVNKEGRSMSICLWKAPALFSKNTCYGMALGPAFSLICF